MTVLATHAARDSAVRHPVTTRIIWFAVVLGLLAVLCVASVSFGVRDVSPAEITAGLRGDTSTIASAAVAARIPRAVLAVLVGAALALAGAAMQAITRNPLADPGILGVSGGASLAVVIGIAYFSLTDPYVTMAVAIVGSAAAAVLVYTVGSLGAEGATPLTLALAGAAVTAALMSLVSAVLLPRTDVMESFRFWQIGGVGGANWDRIGVVTPVLLIGAFIVLASARGMNSLTLGDEVATSLGERVTRTRLIAAAGAVILCGAATAVAGPIAFVGLVIPHMCRLLVGPDHRWLIPFAAVAGAALLVASDVIGRLVSRPSEIEVGIITALVGAPVFIAIVRRQRVRGL
ncbi:iron chelate uptake ABC transporter family permease subunit [Microbacterium sp.]|uniref:FecCD family ABC transporter permease n=1 Tax=Microbacterium sp. TaxID=51671 RepID=UPI0025E92D6F|nr:iron chelate uptake ABC transporter family permease subunit [Microbacterium sp.]